MFPKVGTSTTLLRVWQCGLKWRSMPPLESTMLQINPLTLETYELPEFQELELYAAQILPFLLLTRVIVGHLLSHNEWNDEAENPCSDAR